MNRRKILIFAIIFLSVLASYVKWRIPYNISKQNVKTIYFTYLDKGMVHKIEVSDADKDMIISEVSKFKNSGVEGQVGTVLYKFIIEMVDETEFSFYENSQMTIEITSDKDGFTRNIEAPKTAQFIQRFLKEHSIAK